MCTIIIFYSISYVRFDGKLSAKRRQETLERFCVPLEDSTSPTPSAPAPSLTPAPLTRRRSQPMQMVLAGDSDEDVNDADFIAAEDSDDSFLDDDAVFKPLKKGKGKGKGKAKTSNSREAENSRSHSSMPVNGTNPKVMLISLKAGALGLNLTVANNVYLYVTVCPHNSNC